MAKYVKAEDAYEWQLNVPPHAVIVLLQAVCVDMTGKDATIRQIQHLLWGPKSWGVSVQGLNFVLIPLDRRTWQRIFGNHCGAIGADKAGSRVRLCFKSDPSERLALRTLVLGVVSLLAIAGSTVAVLNHFWFGVVGVLAICAWFLFSFLWLMPSMARSDVVGFLDQAFSNHSMSANDSQLSDLQATTLHASKWG